MKLRNRSAAARAFEPTGLVLLDPRALSHLYSPWSSYRGEEPFEREYGCAIVEIEGPLMQRGDWCWDGYDRIEQRLVAALADQGTLAVVLRIDSYGGDAAGCFEAVRSMRAAVAASGKPVIAYADEAAASAAYALATVASEIWLPETGCVGSVGAITVMRDRVAANALAGLNVKVIASGKHKADGHPDQPLSPDALATAQSGINRLAGLFADVVAEGRKGLSAGAILGFEAAVFDGNAAVTAKLADNVGSFPEACAAAVALAKRASPTGARATKTTTGPRAQGDQKMKTLLAALGLPETATEEQAIAALAAIKDAPAQLAALTGKASLAEQLGTISAWKSGAVANADLAAKFAKIEADKLAAEHAALMTDGLESGAIDTALEPWARKQSVEGLKDFLASASKRVPGGKGGTQPVEASSVGKPWEELTSAEKHRLRNDNPEAFKALKADHDRRKGAR